jgi:uncharacterized membrane protein SpoIIM required for sporulation
MILDLKKFVTQEKPGWDELERMLDEVDADLGKRWSLGEIRRYHYLHGRLVHSLARLSTFAAQGELRDALSSLVARSHAHIHQGSGRRFSWKPASWFLVTVPQAFRRQLGAFLLALGVTLGGAFFGGGALLLDPQSKEVLMPFPHLMQSPGERVSSEERNASSEDSDGRATFSASLMTHNTRVSLFAAGLGSGWGLGTIILLFYNGAILGAVCADFLAAGQGWFLAGWLLPHGSIEIPAILIGGQAGFVLAGAVIGLGDRAPMRARLRAVAADVVHLMGGLMVMLVWAGCVESFFSQIHEPVLPYALKICFGLAELVILGAWLWRGGRTTGGED